MIFISLYSVMIFIIFFDQKKVLNIGARVCQQTQVVALLATLLFFFYSFILLFFHFWIKFLYFFNSKNFTTRKAAQPIPPLVVCAVKRVLFSRPPSEDTEGSSSPMLLSMTLYPTILQRKTRLFWERRTLRGWPTA